MHSAFRTHVFLGCTLNYLLLTFWDGGRTWDDWFNFFFFFFKVWLWKKSRIGHLCFWRLREVQAQKLQLGTVALWIFNVCPKVTC